MSKTNAKPKSARGPEERKHPRSESVSNDTQQVMAQMMAHCCGPEMMAKMAGRMGSCTASRPAEPTEEKP